MTHAESCGAYATPTYSQMRSSWTTQIIYVLRYKIPKHIQSIDLFKWDQSTHITNAAPPAAIACQQPVHTARAGRVGVIPVRRVASWAQSRCTGEAASSAQDSAMQLRAPRLNMRERPLVAPYT